MNSGRTYTLDVILENVIYHVTVRHYPGCPGGYWDPGDSGETWPENIVDIEFPTGREDVTTLGVMLLTYAHFEGIDLEDAEEHLRDALHIRAQVIHAEQDS